MIDADLERHDDADAASMAASALLFSTFLLHEVDAELIRRLENSGARARLQEMGLHLPDADAKDAIESLAADYFETFVKPLEGPPPVQSLAEGDSFEGEPAKAMRAIADAAGVSFDAAAARGAPVDHLGAQLAMWAHIHLRDHNASREFAERHLRWSLRHLDRGAQGEAFYDHLSKLVAEFIRSLS